MDSQEQERMFADLKALGEQAHTALTHLARTAEAYKAELARTYGLEAEKIQLFVTEHETKIGVDNPNFSHPETMTPDLVQPYSSKRK